MGKELEHFDEFVENLNSVNIRRKPGNYFVEMNKNEMLDFIDRQQNELLKAQALFIELQSYTDLFEIRQANIIMKHWKKFNAFMDQNEEFKEEWDALCMAIRLKED